MGLTKAQKKVILVIKSQGGAIPENVIQELDQRVVNNLMAQDILRRQNGQLLLVEYGKTPAERHKSARPVKTRLCLCGCQEATRGGRFMPGHDGRIRGKVITYLKTGECGFDLENPDVMAYLQSAHWMENEMWRKLNDA